MLTKGHRVSGGLSPTLRTLPVRIVWAGTVIAIAGMLAIGVVRWVVWPHAGGAVTEAMTRMAQASGLRLVWHDAVLEWDGIHPVIRVDRPWLSAAVPRPVDGPQPTAMSAQTGGLRAGTIRLDLSWRSLLAWRPVFRSIEIRGPQLTIVRDRRGGWSAVGLPWHWGGQAGSLARDLPWRAWIDREIGQAIARMAPGLRWVALQGDVRVDGLDLKLMAESGDQAAGSPTVRELGMAGGGSIVAVRHAMSHEVRISFPAVNGADGRPWMGQLDAVGELHRPLLRTDADRPDAWSLQLQVDAADVEVSRALDLMLTSVQRAELSTWARRANAVDSVSGVASMHVAAQVREGVLAMVEAGIDSPAMNLPASMVRIDGPSGRAGDAGLSDGEPRREILRLAPLRIQARAEAEGRDRVRLSIPTFSLAAADGARVDLAERWTLAHLDAETADLLDLRLRLDRLDGQRALEAARRWFGDMLPEWVSRLHVSGHVTGPSLVWSRPTASATPMWRLQAGLDDASAWMDPNADEAVQRDRLQVPGARHLDGVIDVTQSGGFIELDSGAASHTDKRVRPGSARHGTELLLGGIFAEAVVPVDALSTRVEWSAPAGDGPSSGWDVRIAHLDVSNRDLAARASGRWHTRPGTHGHLDLQGSFSRVTLARVGRYLPVQIRPSVRQWAVDAIGAGHADSGTFVVQGVLDEFPFRHHDSGRFIVDASIRDGHLKFGEAWPEVAIEQGRLVLDGPSLRVRAERGTMADLPFTQADARIDDLRSAELAVDARASGSIGQYLKLVGQSPLGDIGGGIAKGVEGRGTAQVQLKLHVPLAEPARTRFAAQVALQKVALSGSTMLPAVSDLSGQGLVTDAGVSQVNLAGRWLDGPLEIRTQPGSGGEAAVELRGRLAVASAAQWMRDPLLQMLDGHASYHARWQPDRRGGSWVVSSDLVGVASRLPAPAAKSPEAPWPMKLTVTPSSGSGPAADTVRMKLADGLGFEAVVARATVQAPPRLLRALLSNDPQSALPDSGLAIRFTGQRLDLDAWIAALGRGGQGTQEVREAKGTIEPVALTVVADEVRVTRRDLHTVAVSAMRRDDQWRVRVASREVEGDIEWRARDLQRQGRLTARFGRLHIPDTDPSLAPEPPEPVTDLPAITLLADRFSIGSVDLGSFELRATNRRQGTARSAAGTAEGLAADDGAGTGAGVVDRRRTAWEIEKLRIANRGGVVEATGESERNTRLRFRLDVIDAGDLLSRFGVRGAVAGAPGVLEGELAWPGTALAFGPRSLQGTLKLAVGHGQFLKVDPGAAKLVGVLSLQALPRFLSLDFRNLFDKGFVFDRIAGDVRIDDGVARTSNLAMQGLSAVVQIGGSADLVNNRQDLEVTVLPNLNASVATLAFAAIVNPAVGLGAFLAQTVLDRPISKALALRYRITGPWGAPQVTDLNRNTTMDPATNGPVHGR